MSAVSHAGLSKFLDRLLLRSELSPEECAAILNLKCQTFRAPARTDIVSQGATVDHACLVVDGVVGRFDEMRDGSRQITAFHIAGDLCDIHSVVAPKTGWAIAALSRATILKIPHTALREIAVAYPKIAFAFWRDTTVDASVLAKWVANLGRTEATIRLAHLLCEIGIRSELAGLGTRTSFVFDATQEQIADALGLTSVHVNRVLRVLRAEAFITMQSRGVHVPDWDRLASLAEFDPGFLLLPQSAAATPLERAPQTFPKNGDPEAARPHMRSQQAGGEVFQAVDDGENAWQSLS